MKVISVSNVKGGVGKTTTAAVLAAGLTAKGYKVLMIDSDPQTNLTMCFMPEPQDGTPSLYHVYAEGKTLDEVEEETEKDISVVGLLLTKYTDRTNVARLLEKSVNSAAELLNTKVFDSRIRQATVLQESQIAKIDLLEYAPKAPVTADYQAFIDELLERIEV